MHIREEGAGPAVLLLHGCPSTTRGFEPLVKRLSASRRVLVVDLPGYGASPPLDGPYTLPRVEELLVGELLARGVRELSVVGHSGGAYRALSLAMSTRICIDRVVAVSGLAGYGDDVRAGFRRLATMIRAGSDLGPVWLPRMAGPLFAERFPGDVADVMAWLTAAPRAALAAEIDAFAVAEDLRPRLRELPIPILTRVGDADQAAPPQFSRDIVDRAPAATLQIVPGCGHALFYEDRDGTVEAIAAFLGSAART